MSLEFAAYCIFRAQCAVKKHNYWAAEHYLADAARALRSG